MVNYRRSTAPGGVFFFTVTLQDRKSNLLVENIHLLREAIGKVRTEQFFQIKAYVILPEHLHMIWQLPIGDSDYSQRWKKIKTLFAKSLHKSGLPLIKTKHNEFCLWQRRFWEHTIKDEADFINHVNYIHYNPIKHGLVKSLHHWPYSSFHHYVKKGIISKNWGDLIFEPSTNLGFGE
ncbi:Transposase and inactivated derivatives [Legionella beliardensis]|uniref:Transposase and inactivated derivatives n=1 Tax=Legionella beliardensis TaxID=91822 RepID=A0A378HZY3_9GAMM|nr:transposase [Legionella beliardensis]STX28479.1 Transposase and inactivated derivatives [Legionella beliardensis]